MEINTWSSDRHSLCVETLEEAPGGGEFQVFGPKFYTRPGGGEFQVFGSKFYTRVLYLGYQLSSPGGASLRQGLCKEEDAGSIWC